MTPSNKRSACACGHIALLLVLLSAQSALAQVPDKWSPSGGANPSYEQGGNPGVKHGAEGGGFIRSVANAPQRPAGLETELAAAPYVGKRVRLSGFVKTESVESRASLWIRVEGPNGIWLAGDNMDGRSIKGTTDWKKYDLVVDVPTDSVNIAVGMNLTGAGRLWVDGVTMAAVGLDVPVTDRPGRWIVGASTASDYEIGGDPTASHGSQAGGYIRSVVPAPKGIGSLFTWIVPRPFLGRRVRLSGFVRTESVEKSVGLALSAGGAHDATLGFDNMWDRPVKGTTDWKKYDVVIDVSTGCVVLAYGVYMEGGGKAWVDGMTLETVGPEVAVTGRPSWFPTGSNPEDYEMGGDPMQPHGSAGGGYIRSKVEAPRTFGTWASSTPVGSLLGRRVRLSGHVRTEGVENWSGLWMRVDGPNNQTLAFDNMSSRSIRGTTDWKKYDVVLDVPANAVGLMYGLILTGKGKAWFDGVTLETVAAEVPVTLVKNPFTEYYAGRYAEAAKLFPDRVANEPASLSLRLFQFLALVRSGHPDDARIYINDVASDLTDQKWAGPVVLFYAGKLSEEDVLKAAASADATLDKQQKCEAYYYLAMAYLLKLGTVPGDAASNAVKAQEYLQKCVDTGVTTFVEYRAARAELERMRK